MLFALRLCRHVNSDVTHWQQKNSRRARREVNIRHSTLTLNKSMTSNKNMPSGPNHFKATSVHGFWNKHPRSCMSHNYVLVLNNLDRDDRDKQGLLGNGKSLQQQVDCAPEDKESSLKPNKSEGGTV